MGTRLYIGNMSWDTTEDTLMAVLSEGGRTVKDLHIVTDRETGRPRGFAFVEMSSDAEAQAAIEALDGTALDGRNITVNVIAPGFVPTALTESVLTEENRQAAIEATPLGRLGTAEDVAGAVLFLASDDASFITGQASDGSTTAASLPLTIR